MDANLDKIAKDLYGKIQTRFRNIKIGDENAEVLSKKEDIPRARFFEFEYEEDGEALGTIAITLDPEDGVVMQVSGDLVDDNDNTTHRGAYKFIRGFRQFAKDRLLNFDVQNIGKSNLDKRDYTFQAKRKDNLNMPSIMENKLYGNNRMSYQDLGEARLVIKHNQPINMDLPAGRTMHIEGIYIENNQGERFKYPFKHINGARALAEHIKHGGTPYDSIGKHICKLSEELAHLRKFKGYVNRQEQLSEAMANVTGRVVERIEQIKETIHKLQRTEYYNSFVESFEDSAETMIPEEVQNDLIDRLTIRTFNEELKDVFPYIYKFVDESELPVLEVGVDDLMSEVFDGDKETGTTHKGGKVTKTAGGVKHEKQYPDSFDNSDDSDDHKGAEKYASGGPKKHHFKKSTPESQYESFLDDIVREDKNEILSPNASARSVAIDKLNGIIAQNMQVGPNGDNGIMTMRGLIDDTSFTDAVKAVPAETDLNDIIRGWLETEHEDVLAELNFPADEDVQDEPAPVEPAPAPVEPAPVEPAPAAPVAAEPAPEPAPVAEGSSDDKSPPWDVDPTDKSPFKKSKNPNRSGKDSAKSLAQKGMADAVKKAKAAGATLETQMDFGYGVKTLSEILSDCGMSPQDVGFAQPQDDGLQGMLRYISGFYNKDEGNFPLGGMRVKIKVKKAFEDGEFGNAAPEELLKVIKFIDAKDPSGNEHNQVMRLSGVKQVAETPSQHGIDISALETQLQDCAPSFSVNESSEELSSLIALSKRLRT